jgi:hypothetical protein
VDEDEPAAKHRKLIKARHAGCLTRLRCASETPPQDIFLRGGPKKELAAGQLFSTAEDLPLLNSRLDALESAWQLEHAPAARFVSYALWPPGSSTCELLLKRGKGWNAFGQHQGPRTVLSAEEALFLMESDRLVVFRSATDPVPLSLHAGYAAALAAGVTPERYAAFSHLCRLGFVVHRHGTPWFLDSREAEAAAAADGAAEECPEPSLPSVEDLGAAAMHEPAADLDDPEALAPDADADADLAEPEPEAEAEPVAAVEAEPPAADAPPLASREWWSAKSWSCPADFPGRRELAVDAAPAAAECAEARWAPQLLYDVWPPQSAFTKRRVGKPFFRVALCTPHPPSAADTARLSQQSGLVPVKYVIVQPGIVIGFDVSVVGLCSVPKKKGNR